MTNFWEEEEGKRGSHFCGAEARKGMKLNLLCPSPSPGGRGKRMEECVCVCVEGVGGVKREEARCSCHGFVGLRRYRMETWRTSPTQN